MLKSELDNLIKTNCGQKYGCTMDEFDRVESIYMSDEKMTKEDAFKVWKALYWKTAKKRQADFEAPLTEKEVHDVFYNDENNFNRLNGYNFTTRIRSHHITYYVSNRTNAGWPIYKAQEFTIDKKLRIHWDEVYKFLLTEDRACQLPVM